MDLVPVRSLASAPATVVGRVVPGPDQVVAAASNVAHKVLYGGLADLRPMPRTLIDEGRLREVYHYRPSGAVKEQGDPILLVTPLAAPAICYDLRRGCSLVEHFVTEGRPTYLVEYGEVSFRDRNLGMEHWVDEVVPSAIRAVSEHAGGRPVHVIGWSLGGIFSLLTLADERSGELPVASLTVVGSPIDISLVPLLAPFRPLLYDVRSGERMRSGLAAGELALDAAFGPNHTMSYLVTPRADLAGGPDLDGNNAPLVVLRTCGLAPVVCHDVIPLARPGERSLLAR